ncbi:hypothetical protein Efla_001173 [Eimeria flavescens]
MSSSQAPRTAGSTPADNVPHFPEQLAAAQVPAAIVKAESTAVPCSPWPFSGGIFHLSQAGQKRVSASPPSEREKSTFQRSGRPQPQPTRLMLLVWRGASADPTRAQSTFLSYSFRNNEAGARPWGANDGEEKEENSDSDEEEDEYQSKCLTVLRGFIRAVFPHSYPLIWLVLPFVLFACLFVADHGDLGEASREKLVVFVRDAPMLSSSSTAGEAGASVLKEITRRELLQQGLVVLVFIALFNSLAWVGCMLIRAVILTVVVNAGLYERQTVSSLLTTIDPELFYFVWSIGVFLFWQDHLVKGRFFAVSELDANKTIQQLYFSAFLCSSRLMTEFYANFLKSICLVIVLLATRRLVQSIMVFCFELGFMANMSGELGKYLTKYAALRKLNTRWAAYQMYKGASSQCSEEGNQDEDERSHLDHCLDELRRGRSTTSAASRVSRISRCSRHASIRMPMRVMPSLVKEELEVTSAGMPRQYKETQSPRAPKDAGVRFVARAVRANYFRFRFHVSQNIQARELRGQGIPSQLTRSSIERIKSSKIHHWVLLQYVAVFPPAIFLNGRRIELDSKATARSAATSLFAALAADASELANDSQPKEHYQKSRATVFSECLQPSKQQPHACETERTVTWLDSHDLQKAVPLDPVEEGTLTAATATCPTAADPAASGCLGNSANGALVNNSTNSTEPLMDAGGRTQSPSRASEVPPSASSPATEESPSTARLPDARAAGDGSSTPSQARPAAFNSESKETGSDAADMLGPPPAATTNSLLEKPSLQPASHPASQADQSSQQGPANDEDASAPGDKQQDGLEDTSEEESDNLEYLEGSFEFSVAQAKADGQTRATRRGRTQHIATLTPFNIAIRSPSVDVDAEDLEAEYELTGYLDRRNMWGFFSAQRNAFSADQHQASARPLDSFAINLQAEETAFAHSSSKAHRRKGASADCRPAGWRSAGPGGPDSDVELSAASQQHPSLHFTDGEEGGSFEAAECLSRGRTLPRVEDADEGQQKQLRVARDAAMLGAVNINSSLFNDGDFGTTPYLKSAHNCPDLGGGSPTNEGCGNRRLLDPNNAGEEDYGRRVRHGSVQSAPEYFTRQFVEIFLKGDEVDEFMKEVDLAGHGKINKSMFKRAVISIYKMRKALLKSLTSQASICKTVRRMISIVLWAATLVAMLLVFGVNLNTVIVSGAAAISALTVALSYIYQNFITAVIFVAFTNPYNVGDRIRVDGGDAMYVRSINTYTTEFVTIYGKPIVYSNTVLFGRQLTNESRSTNATFSLPMRLDIRTQLQSLRLVEAGMRKAIALRPMDFVKDAFSIYITDVQPGRYMDRVFINLKCCVERRALYPNSSHHLFKAPLNRASPESASYAFSFCTGACNNCLIEMWLTSVEGWGNFAKVFRLRTDMYLVLQRLCMRLGISYQEPLLPVHLAAAQPPPVANPQPAAPLGPGHYFQQTAAHGAANGAASMLLANLPEFGAGECYQGSPPDPSGVLLSSLHCEPASLQGFGAPRQNSAAQADAAGHGEWASRSTEGHYRELNTRKAQTGVSRTVPDNRPRQWTGRRAPSCSSAASNAELLLSERSSFSICEEEEEGRGSRRTTGQLHRAVLSRSKPMASAADGGEREGPQTPRKAGHLRAALTSEFDRRLCEDSGRPRRRHRTTAPLFSC